MKWLEIAGEVYKENRELFRHIDDGLTDQLMDGLFEQLSK